MAFLLVALSMITTRVTQAGYEELDVLRQYDVVLDADPGIVRENYAHGDDSWRYKHPLEAYIFSIPLRILTLGVEVVSGDDFDARQFRSDAILWAFPLLSGLRTLLLLLVLAVVGVPEWHRFGFASLEMSSFTAIAYAGIPESFQVSAVLLALLGLLVVTDVKGSRRLPWWVWIAYALVAIGNMITLGAAVGIGLIVAGLARAGGSFDRDAFRRAIVLPAAALALMVPLVYGLTRLFQNGLEPLGEDVHFLPVPMLQAGEGILAAFGRMFVGRVPEVTANPSVHPGDPHEISLVLADHLVAGDLPALVGVLLLLGLGTWGWLRRSATGPAPAEWALALTMAAVLAVNAGIHLIYARHYFLYTPHWLVPTVLLGAGLSALVRGRRAGTALLTGALFSMSAFLMVWNLGIWAHMLDLIRAPAGG